MYAQQQQQQGANLLFHQYNQLASMQDAYSNPSLASVTYAQQPIDHQQQQQLYRTDQLVPQTQSQIPTPVQQQQQQLQQQLQQQFQQNMQSSSPINMISISSPDAWLTGSPMPQNPDAFRPISLPVSRTMLDIVSYNNRTNSISSNPPTPLLSASFDLSQSPHRYYSKQQASPETQRQRQRLHSGSSCYESDPSDFSNDDDDEFEVRKNIFLFTGA
jgi:hypothetical protein